METSASYEARSAPLSYPTEPSRSRKVLLERSRNSSPDFANSSASILPKILEPLRTRVHLADPVLHVPTSSGRRPLSRRRRRDRTDLRDAALLLGILAEARCMCTVRASQ